MFLKRVDAPGCSWLLLPGCSLLLREEHRSEKAARSRQESLSWLLLAAAGGAQERESSKEAPGVTPDYSWLLLAAPCCYGRSTGARKQQGAARSHS